MTWCVLGYTSTGQSPRSPYGVNPVPQFGIGPQQPEQKNFQYFSSSETARSAKNRTAGSLPANQISRRK
eukprot:CAMPEP_0194047062 /NCGR_PEP_ID=MMETSP0009_2-20130614/23536_1 /TAXON_ID=210454 /ORGANISM="Grammatophora oceanica, Strain CCMP 410" /LENGTH=68 /DNA_ID=CAMNT_0038692577 /DNA_START=647 /DNA_END=854 /DNA_ORIENTATION=-